MYRRNTPKHPRAKLDRSPCLRPWGTRSAYPPQRIHDLPHGIVPICGEWHRAHWHSQRYSRVSCLCRSLQCQRYSRMPCLCRSLQYRGSNVFPYSKSRTCHVCDNPRTHTRASQCGPAVSTWDRAAFGLTSPCRRWGRGSSARCSYIRYTKQTDRSHNESVRRNRSRGSSSSTASCHPGSNTSQRWGTPAERRGIWSTVIEARRNGVAGLYHGGAG